jgi:tetratricopeptide (TPR) repeat protein
MRAGRLERAAESFLQAIAQDSGFAIAHYRLALARDWAGLPGFEESTRAAVRHAQRLAPRDRALLEALEVYFHGDAIGAERRYRAILARYPDDLDARFQLAEVLFHYGPLHGRAPAESEEAWRAVLAYEPRNRPAIMHLARVATVGGRVGGLDTLLAPFSADELVRDRRLAQAAAFRALAARDTAAVFALAEIARGWEDAAVYQFAAYLTAYSGEPALARHIVRELIQPHRGRGTNADLHWFLALLHLANGQLSAARASLATAATTKATLPSAWQAYAFAAVTDWSATMLPLPYADSTLERARARAAGFRIPAPETAASAEPDRWLAEELWRAELGQADVLEAIRHYTVGNLSLRLRDTETASGAARALARLAGAGANPLVRDLERGLRAQIAAHGGRAAEGLRLLEQLELAPTALAMINVLPFGARPHERYLRGELLASLGRERDALAWFASLGALSGPETAFRAPAHLRQAELYERLGEQRQAAQHYTRFLELWNDSDAELQPLVRAARARLAELTPQLEG